MASAYGSYYGTLASYFGQSGGNSSAGKGGGAGYQTDQVSGANSTGDQQAPTASSGSGWISAAASMASTDKSSFSTPFEQGFGGIANFQVIGSPGAIGATQSAPISAPPSGSPFAPSSSPSVAVIAVLLLAALAAAKYLMRS